MIDRIKGDQNMPETGKLREAGASKNKRTQFESSDRKNWSTRALFAIGSLLIAVVAGYLFMTGGISEAGESGHSPAVTDGDFVKISLADLAGGKALFFDYVSADRRKARFFVVKSIDGRYRAAFDACDVCYRAKKGYFQDGDDMVCRNCGRHFRTTDVNEISGGCNPIGIPQRIEDGHVVIAASDLDAGLPYF